MARMALAWGAAKASPAVDRQNSAQAMRKRLCSSRNDNPSEAVSAPAMSTLINIDTIAAMAWRRKPAIAIASRWARHINRKSAMGPSMSWPALWAFFHAASYMATASPVERRNASESRASAIKLLYWPNAV